MLRFYLLVLLTFSSFTLSVFSQWNNIIYLKHAEREKEDLVRVWYETDTVKAFLLSGGIGNAKTFCENSSVREYLRQNNMGILYIRTNYYSMSIFDHAKDSVFLNLVCDTVAKVTGKSSFRNAPWVIFGHSTDGLFVQNVAPWKPEKTLGMLYYKSGNLGNPSNMKEPFKTLDRMKDIPLMAINGRFEEFGPNGPFPGCTSPYPLSCYRETQWLAMRDTLMKLRAIDYLVTMAVDYYGSATHNSWSIESGELMAKFAVDITNGQLPAGYNGNTTVALNRYNRNATHLTDTIISQLIDDSDFPSSDIEASFSEYIGNKNCAFWIPTKSLAVDWINFHRNGKSQYLTNTATSIFNAQENIAYGLSKITIQHKGNFHYQIFNIQGNVVKSVNETDCLTIIKNNFASGVYIVKISSENQITTTHKISII